MEFTHTFSSNSISQDFYTASAIFIRPRKTLARQKNMPQLTPAQLTALQYENWGIYVILSSRGAQPGFHWGIFVPSASPLGTVWHATNSSGGWRLERKDTSNIPMSMSLCVAAKVGNVNSATLETLTQTLDSIPAAGQPSSRNNEPFTCRVWVQDALHALHMARVIVLTKSIEKIVEKLIDIGEEVKPAVENGSSSALVLNKFDS